MGFSGMEEGEYVLGRKHRGVTPCPRKKLSFYHLRDSFYKKKNYDQTSLKVNQHDSTGRTTHN